MRTYQQFYEARMLFGLARAAYERTGAATNDRGAGQDDAFVAVIFSAAALEAFINEAADLASQTGPGSPTTGADPGVTFARLAEEVETHHGGVELKYQLLRLVFTGETYDKGTVPYQDFDGLLALRNALVHHRRRGRIGASAATGSVVESTPILKRLRGRNVLAEDIAEDVAGPWVDWIGTRSVARWACNAASGIVKSIAEVAPASSFGALLRLAHSQIFQPIA